MKKKNLRPVSDLWRMDKEYPEIWDDINHLRNCQDDELSWPSWCFLPVVGCLTLISQAHGGIPISPVEVPKGQLLHVLAGWRISKLIYHFDADLGRELLRTPVRSVPAEVLLHLPSWAVYIDLSLFYSYLFGVYVSLDYTEEHGRELRLVYCLPGDKHVTIPVSLEKETVEEGIREIEASARRTTEVHGLSADSIYIMGDIGISFHSRIISLILYLCSDKADLTPPPKLKKKRKQGKYCYQPAPEPTIIEVGANVGDAIRRAKETGTTAAAGDRTVRSHIRDAHWHTYWTGKGRTKPVLRWLSHILVNPPKDE